MKFKTYNNTDTNGSSFKGGLKATYENLIKWFGEPEHTNQDRTIDALWVLEWEDGTVTTIYNWKNGKIYNGASGLEVTEITYWNVGSKTNLGYNYLCDHIKEINK